MKSKTKYKVDSMSKKEIVEKVNEIILMKLDIVGKNIKKLKKLEQYA